MSVITATDLNKSPGSYLIEAIKEPVVIERSGKPIVVMVSYDNYLKLEDAYWGERALKSDKDKSLKVKESMDFLMSDD